MIGILLSLMIFASVIYSILCSDPSAAAEAAVTSGEQAIGLIITLAGAMAVWGGIMKVADRAGLTKKLTALLKPALKLIYRGLPENSEALDSIAMNTAANLLGLATPLGIDAMKKLEREENPNGRATLNMIKLTVMNACSVEIIPATVAALRAKAGSASPMDILPCVLLVSAASLTVALIFCEIFDLRGKNGH